MNTEELLGRFWSEDIAHALLALELADSAFPLTEGPPLAWVHAVDQHSVNVVVNALVVRVDNVREVRGLQQISVAERLGYELFRFTERSKWVGAVADY